jgi:hypothetical protein
MIINGVIFQRFNNSSAEHTIIHKTLQSIIQNDNASDPIKHTSSNVWIDNAKSRLKDPTSRSRLGRFGKRLGLVSVPRVSRTPLLATHITRRKLKATKTQQQMTMCKYVKWLSATRWVLNHVPDLSEQHVPTNDSYPTGRCPHCRRVKSITLPSVQCSQT